MSLPFNLIASILEKNRKNWQKSCNVILIPSDLFLKLIKLLKISRSKQNDFLVDISKDLHFKLRVGCKIHDWKYFFPLHLRKWSYDDYFTKFNNDIYRFNDFSYLQIQRRISLLVPFDLSKLLKNTTTNFLKQT